MLIREVIKMELDNILDLNQFKLVHQILKLYHNNNNNNTINQSKIKRRSLWRNNNIIIKTETAAIESV